MKKVTLLASLLMAVMMFMADTAIAQKAPKIDKSPHDISYYPQRGKDKVARVLYGRPQAKGREVFGKLVNYGKVWRTGANEATEITFYKDVKINGKTVKAGSYALFTIPGKSEWTVILNNDLHQWGHYSYKDSNDAYRFTVPVKSLESDVEALSIFFDKTSKGAKMIIAWEKTSIEVPIEF